MAHGDLGIGIVACRVQHNRLFAALQGIIKRRSMVACSANADGDIGFDEVNPAKHHPGHGIFGIKVERLLEQVSSLQRDVLP